jgi:glucose-1-phosphate thymidylyltransferase
MKALIPVAGAGTRLRPHTYTQPKPLIPVAGKPIVAHIVDDLVAAGVHQFVFVLGHLGEKIEIYLDRHYPQLDKEYVFQSSREGLGHAVWCARDKISEQEEIIVYLGDTIVEADLQAMLAVEGSVLAVKKVDDPRKFGVAEIEPDGTVTKLSEKPSIPKSNLALVGVYKICDVKLMLEKISVNIDREVKTHGEFQLTDALMDMIEQGHTFHSLTVDNWFDCGRKEILLQTNAILLEKENLPSIPQGANLNSIIIQPIQVGANTTIQNSIVGPHVTIGDNSNISGSIIRDSIIGHFTSIREAVLESSVVGNDASVRGLKHSLNIGDNTEIDFS